MKIDQIKVGMIYKFKNIDSLNDLCNGEKVIVKEIISDSEVKVDFIDYKVPSLRNYMITGKVEYDDLYNMTVTPDELKRA